MSTPKVSGFVFEDDIRGFGASLGAFDRAYIKSLRVFKTVEALRKSLVGDQYGGGRELRYYEAKILRTPWVKRGKWSGWIDRKEGLVWYADTEEEPLSSSIFVEAFRDGVWSYGGVPEKVTVRIDIQEPHYL